MNPLLEQTFDIPFDRIRAEHVEPAISELLTQARATLKQLAELRGERTYSNTLDALDAATERLETAITVVGHLESVASTPELRDAFNRVEPEVSAFFAGIVLDPGIWLALKAFAATPEAKALTGPRRRFLDKTVDDFRRQGADLPAAGKARLEELTRELTLVTTRFSQNTLDATSAWDLVITDRATLAGLPGSAIEAARASAQAKGVEGFRFTLHAPSYTAVMTYLDDGKIREQLFRAYNARGTGEKTDNRALLGKILALRGEKAKLLGYRDFADLVLEDRMAHDGARARAFVKDLRVKAEPAFRRENQELLAFRRKLEGPGAPDLSPWDVGYYAEKQRKALYDFDDEELRPYFRVDRVLEGLFETVHRLYGITVAERKGVPVWHPSVKSFSITDADGTLLGGFYADLHPRDEKRGGAWMNGLITGFVGGTKSPHLGLICANATAPLEGRPALLDHREVETLFHEFGHLLHHLLSRVDIRALAGTKVAWDFVELPSQIMENWCWEREALDLFARHHQSGATIPPALFESMVRARTFRAANAMMRQLGFAAMDLGMHVDYHPERDGADVVAYARKIIQEHAPAKYDADYAMVAAFTHLFGSAVGYAAGYYSYKWAEVLDADAFTRFKQAGIFSAEVGRQFREKLLSRGDSADPMALYQDFMGREPRLEPLLERSGLQG